MSKTRLLAIATIVLAPLTTGAPASAQSDAYSYVQALYLCEYLDATYRVQSHYWRCSPHQAPRTVTLTIDTRKSPNTICAEVDRILTRMNIGMSNWKLEITSPSDLSKPGITCRLHNPTSP